MRIGIFFGGPSREREISFAGGRTVYDNLAKSLFEPVPIFVDSLGQFILLDWQYMYKGTIRDFYPPAKFLPDSPNNFQVYLESLENLDPATHDEIIQTVGRKVHPHEFASLMDFAFLALHGPFGEDGGLQGLLEWYRIPYSGSGLLPSAIGINKVAQRQILEAYQFAAPKHRVVSRTQWLAMDDPAALLPALEEELGLPLVVKAPQQGSSIGVSILKDHDPKAFISAVERSLFIKAVDLSEWQQLSDAEKRNWLVSLVDIREGIGLPVTTATGHTLYHPEALWRYLDEQAATGLHRLALTSRDVEDMVLFESFLPGKEFSCIVVEQADGTPLALPPTQIIKQQTVFDYRSKYLPGMSRKVTPIDVPTEHLKNIREACNRLFTAIHGQVYARIDGFVTEEGTVYLNDPNTTSGMLPSSFFFHQAAEIGLNPSQFLTYIIRTSLAARLRNGKDHGRLSQLLGQLDRDIAELRQAATDQTTVAVVMGGWSTERHISVESGRNIYEKLASSAKYRPLPVFLSGKSGDLHLTVLPVNVLLKDNADDIKEKIEQYQAQPVHPVLQQIRQEARAITSVYSELNPPGLETITIAQLAERVDAVFIALHGRPGEDGELQGELEQYHLPYNGSGVESSQTTINKYDTNEILGREGIKVAQHRLLYGQEWTERRTEVIEEIEASFGYPFIAKPADDGCSSAVKKIKNRAELEAFAELMFRQQEALQQHFSDVLKLKANEEFPQKPFFLIESLIEKGDAEHFLEITGGLLTHYEPDGSLRYEIFEASEALASSEILSLEEKFLAGEGQNLTPARYARDPQRRNDISERVKQELERVARLLNIEGYARIDAFVKIFADGSIETWIIEINSLPGMTPATAIFHQTALAGYKPYDFIDAILTFGQQRVAHKRTATT